MTTQGNRKNLKRWLREQFDIRMGVVLWAIELSEPVGRRRPFKATRAARVLGWLLFVAQHRHAPRSIGCACDPWQRKEAVA